MKAFVAMNRIIDTDSLVRRRSGGPVMLVIGITANSDSTGAVARCAWFDGYRLDGAHIAIDQLMLVETP